MSVIEKEIIIEGLNISGGIAIGYPYFLNEYDNKIHEIFLSNDEVEKEIKRYHQAIKKSSLELKFLQKRFQQEGTTTVVDILEAHITMLNDPVLIQMIEKKIRKTKRNTEYVVKNVVDEYNHRFSKISDETFKERIQDVKDVACRILDKLNYPSAKRISVLPENSIVIATEMFPSDIFDVDLSKIVGFITLKGGPASHAAIIARAKNIPYIARLDIDSLKLMNIKLLIIDADEKKLIINPEEETLEKYKKKKNSYNATKKVSVSDSITKDNQKVYVNLTLDIPSDLNLMHPKIEGVGLCRTEYFFLSNNKFPTEDVQYETYKNITHFIKDKPVIIRLFDFGADKNHLLSYLKNDEMLSNFNDNEMNPMLGCRAIRFLLKNINILKDQIKAIYRASAFGNLHILIPFVTDIYEIKKVKEVISQVKKELDKEGCKYSKNIPLGCMIEVPSTAMIADKILKEVDFLTVGTNDLSQYMLAAERESLYFDEVFTPSHPGIIKLLDIFFSLIKNYKKRVYICGEMASNPKFIPLFLMYGARYFSIGPCYSKEFIELIQKIDVSKLMKIKDEILKFSLSKDVDDYLSDLLNKIKN